MSALRRVRRWHCLLAILASAPAIARPPAHPWPAGTLPPNVPTACESLASVPKQFNIDYAAIHNAWLLGGCTGCHNVTNMGGLRLDVASTGITALVGQPSFRNSEIIRVLPTNPDYSLVYQMLNCTPPDTYPPMPPSMSGTGRIDIQLRALIYDWIEEGARGFDEDQNPVSDVLFRAPFESQRFQKGLAP